MVQAQPKLRRRKARTQPSPEAEGQAAPPVQLSLDFYEHGTQLCVKASVAKSLGCTGVGYHPDTVVVIERRRGGWLPIAVLGRFDSKGRVLRDTKLDGIIRKRQGVTTGEVSA